MQRHENYELNCMFILFFDSWTMLISQLAFCLFLHPQLFPPPSFSISSPYLVKLHVQIAWQKTPRRAVTSAGPLGPAVTSAQAAKGETYSSPAASPAEKWYTTTSITKNRWALPCVFTVEGRTNICSWVRVRCSPVKWSESKKEKVERRKKDNYFFFFLISSEGFFCEGFSNN